MPVRKNRSSISFARRKIASDTQVVIQHTLELEDEFSSIYEITKTNAALMPPFNPLVLKRLCTRNNILMQCVHAMETNVDGTGYEIADEDQDKEDKLPQPHPALEGAPVDFNTIADPTVRAAAAAALVQANKVKVTKEVGPGVVAAAAAAAKVMTRHATLGVDPPSEFPLQPQEPMAVDPTTGEPDPNAETPADLAEKAMLKAFFKEPFPNESFVSQRRKLRADIEMTGNGYLEVIRNLEGKIVFLRHLDASTMRLVKLDNPVMVEKIIERNGVPFKANIWVRERRYVQRVGTNYIYYKEFGSERRLSREDGGWLDAPGQTGFPLPNPGAPHGQAKDSTPLLTLKGDLERQRQMDNGVAPGPASATGAERPANLTNADGTQKVNLASEVLHFICDKDATTPYGIPRWINNLPAVLGSRKAEEFNLDFFDAGGLPPAIIFIQGGALAESVKNQLLAYLGGDLKDKHRAAVVEAQSSSGSLDSAGQVKVTVERFGDNRANGTDSMFQVFDEKCENHVRGAFRLPSIFLGKSDDYNFATALTAVMVTEAQVFAPERKEFDEKINHTIVRALGAKRYILKSLPSTLKNVDLQLKSLEMVADKIKPEDLIDTINQITGLSLTYDPEAAAQAQQQALAEAQAGKPFGGGDPNAQGSDPTKNPFSAGLGTPSSGGTGSSAMSSAVTKSDLTSNDIVLLAGQWANAVGLSDGPRMDKELRRAIVQKVETLPKEQRKLFDAVLANSTFARSSFDAEGLAELAGCCVGLMDHSH